MTLPNPTRATELEAKAAMDQEPYTFRRLAVALRP